MAYGMKHGEAFNCYELFIEQFKAKEKFRNIYPENPYLGQVVNIS